jgi:YggT family protein
MGLIALAIYWLLQAFSFALIGRFIVDLVLSFNRGWQPRGLVVVVVESVYTITDPALKLIRRIIPPLRIGAVQLDFGWTILLLAIGFAQRAVLMLA